MTLIRRYRAYDLPPTTSHNILRSAAQTVATEIGEIDTEFCFYIAASRELSPDEHRVLDWLLAETFEPHRYGAESSLDQSAGTILEIGPRMTFTTAWSTNAVSICHACGITDVVRV